MSGEPPGALIGRAAEAAAIRHKLDGARLVTVTGLPGVGKTAVSLAAAGPAAGSFADGSLLLRLDALRDEALLPDAIAAALRLPDRVARGRLDVLVDQLRDRHLLLILDTCEHLIGACAALVAALLPPCPGMRVLATSREPLRVPGEATVAVCPLRLADAVELFGRRAAQAGVGITPQDQAAVAWICGQLDKLPLAIELAASELGRLSPGGSPTAALAGLAARLAADGDLRRGPGRPEQHRPARHRTLRAAIGWSYELCTPSERLLWARLSVFTGPFGPRDAQDVCACAELSEVAVAAGLSLLAERSVLLTGQQDGGDTRFALPVTLRAYGRRMLRRLGQEDEFEERHQRWQDGRRGRRDDPAGT